MYEARILSAIVEIIGVLAGGCMLKKLGVRASICISMCLPFIGSILLLLFGVDEESVGVRIALLLAKLGISSAFNISFSIHPLVYPLLF